MIMSLATQQRHAADSILYTAHVRTPDVLWALGVHFGQHAVTLARAWAGVDPIVRDGWGSTTGAGPRGWRDISVRGTDIHVFGPERDRALFIVQVPNVMRLVARDRVPDDLAAAVEQAAAEVEALGQERTAATANGRREPTADAMARAELLYEATERSLAAGAAVWRVAGRLVVDDRLGFVRPGE